MHHHGLLRGALTAAPLLLSLALATPAAAQAAANPIGVGCPGSGGVPQLTASQGPWIGEGITFTVSNLPSVPGMAWLLFSSNDFDWGGIPLPIDLAIVGAPGCMNYIWPRTGIWLPHTTTSVTYSELVPNMLVLLNYRLVCQALVCDHAAGNALHATTSNALELLFGQR